MPLSSRRIASLAVGLHFSLCADVSSGFVTFATGSSSSRSGNIAFLHGGAASFELRMASGKNVDNDSPFAAPEERRKEKKNKYAKFSKVDSAKEDPLEQLIQQSNSKIKAMEEEKIEESKPIEFPIPDGRLEYPSIQNINPYDPESFGYVEIGTVLGPHGVHGWTKVRGCTDFPERLTRPGMLLHMKALHKRAPRKVVLADGKATGVDEGYLIQLQGVYNRTEAQKLKGATLYYATQQDTMIEDDILISDLVGFHAYHIENPSISIGTVHGIVLASELCSIPGLGHDYLELKLPTKEKSDLVLIPSVPEIVRQIDLEKRQVIIEPPPGLLDLTYVREEKVKIKGYLPPAKS